MLSSLTASPGLPSSVLCPAGVRFAVVGVGWVGGSSACSLAVAGGLRVALVSWLLCIFMLVRWANKFWRRHGWAVKGSEKGSFIYLNDIQRGISMRI